jgi:hypothetical protein
MKKSAKVTLTVVATVGLASCGRRHPDPCDAATFNEQACQQAVSSGGYYYGGSWHSMHYGYPYPYYFDSYHRFMSHGGHVVSEPVESYRGTGTIGQRFGTSPSSPGASGTPSSGSATHGGFGHSGAAHSSGGE